MNFNQALLILKKYNQTHLLQYYNQLSEKHQKDLLSQISNIDFSLISSLYKHFTTSYNDKTQYQIRPIKSINYNDLNTTEINKLYDIGLNKLKEGKVAVLLIAGGQGSRLGFNGPKGVLNINLPSNKSLFQIYVERLINLNMKSDNKIPIYIMTNDFTLTETQSFFQKNNYFNYDKSYIHFFTQTMLPIIDTSGNILLKNKDTIAMSPNGNGDCFSSLLNSKLFADMKKRNIEWISIIGVDNILVKPADPTFLGFAINSNTPISSKAVSKKSPTENVGVFCYKNNTPSVVEYSELPSDMKFATTSSNELVYDCANILNHFVNITFIEKALNHDTPFHLAHKKVAFLDMSCKLIAPSEPNAYKFEKFIFDYFSLASDMSILKVDRCSEFSPIKNKIGNDSPYSAKNSLLALHKKWLLDNHINKSIIQNKTLEISPLISYDGENLDISYITNLLSTSNEIELNDYL